MPGYFSSQAIAGALWVSRKPTPIWWVAGGGGTLTPALNNRAIGTDGDIKRLKKERWNRWWGCCGFVDVLLFPCRPVFTTRSVAACFAVAGRFACSERLTDHILCSPTRISRPEIFPYLIPALCVDGGSTLFRVYSEPLLRTDVVREGRLKTVALCNGL